MAEQNGVKRNFTLLRGGTNPSDFSGRSYQTTNAFNLTRGYTATAAAPALCKPLTSVQAPPESGKDADTSQILPFGLFELDTSGIVRHYAPSDALAGSVEKRDIVGRNFFTELIPNEQGRDWQVRFRTFMASCGKTDKFAGIFDYNGRPIKIHFVLAHLSERRDEGHRRMALVRVMPEN